VQRAVRSLRQAWPDGAQVRLGLRNGDTAPQRRRRHLIRPPQILFTTPESLAILLSQSAGRAMFGSLRWVIVDEVHALVGNKRGVDLALSLERMEEFVQAGQGRGLQRIGLSATCTPLELAARFLVGVDRLCTIARVPDAGKLDLTIEPLPAEDATGRRGFMARLLDRLHPVLKQQKTTLIFTNIRSLAERVIWGLRRRYPRHAQRFAVHHSALALDVRRRAERRLKQGKLRAVVSSTSLELGVDIGSVECVVFVHPPGGVVRLLQRVGRSGHGPGLPRRGLLLTAGAADLLEATVTAASCHAGQLEPLRDTPLALDVLCQHLVGMAMGQAPSWDQAYRLVRRAWPYRDLSRADFQCCLDYLSGRHQDGREWLPPRFTIVQEKTARLLRRNLGTILAEDATAVRLRLPQVDELTQQRLSVPVGSLDESYVDHLQPGDRFLLDGRCFEFQKMQDQAVLVDEALALPLVPRWVGAGWALSAELASRLFTFRQRLAEALREGTQEMERILAGEFHLGLAAQAELIDLFLAQERCSEIPALGALLIEGCRAEHGVAYCFHTPLSRSGNDSLARVLAWRLQQTHGWLVDIVVADLGFMLAPATPASLGPEDWRELLNPEDFTFDLDQALRDSPSLRERFARVATTGLMLLRQGWGRRRKVGGHAWAQRRLFDQTRAADPSFLFLRQAEAEMKHSSCDGSAAAAYVARVPKMDVRCRWLAEISPFAAAWTQPGQVSSVT
jgi:ATP-dependent Lhr-like helicase